MKHTGSLHPIALRVLSAALSLALFILAVQVISCRGKTSGAQQADAAADTPAFQEACLNGDLENVTRYINRGGDINAADSSGRTPLMFAAFNGHTQIVKLLLDAGAGVNQVDSFGRSALLYGSTGPFPATVELLLLSGADPNMADLEEHFTPLMHAAAEGHNEVVRVLIAHGADPDMEDIDGDTAESFALQAGHQEVADFLRDRKAGE